MTTLPSAGRTRWAPWVALVVGIAFVVGWNAALRDVRYPYFGDSASWSTRRRTRSRSRCSRRGCP
jgi:hypothetical protein